MKKLKPFLSQMGCLQQLHLHSLFSPLKKFRSRIRSRHHRRNRMARGRGGIYVLYEDVKSCPYEDVHVLWSMLVENHNVAPSS